MSALRRLCVFCGSSPGLNPAHTAAARHLGETLAREGIGLVYGGGAVGLMGVVAGAVMANGGEVIGVIPRALATKEIAHHGLTELHVVASMHERKALMAERSDAFLALPGGFGTLDEMFEILTLDQTEKMSKKLCVLLYGSEYWDQVLHFQPLVEWGAISEQDLGMLCRVDTVEDAFEQLKKHLTEHHIVPETAQESTSPGIAKTRS